MSNPGLEGPLFFYSCQKVKYSTFLEYSHAAYQVKWNHKCAMTCNFQQCGILTSVDSYEPVQPPFKLRNFKCCLVSGLRLIENSSDKQRL